MNVWGDIRADKARDFIGKGQPGGEQQSKGTQENFSTMCLEVSGFMGMGSVSWLSLANRLALPILGLAQKIGHLVLGDWPSPPSYWPLPDPPG